MSEFNRKALDEGMMLKQEDPRMEEGYRKVKLSHFGSQGEWYGRVQEGEMKGQIIQFQAGERFLYKVPSRFSDDETYELRMMDDNVQPWCATVPPEAYENEITKKIVIPKHHQPKK